MYMTNLLGWPRLGRLGISRITLTYLELSQHNITHILIIQLYIYLSIYLYISLSLYIYIYIYIYITYINNMAIPNGYNS